MKSTLAAVALSFIAASLASAANERFASKGRAPDSSAKTISEIRAAERRKIPLEVALRASAEYSRRQPVNVTIMVTNLFEEPLLLNRRMLVNHPRLQGEVSFRILGPDGLSLPLQRPVTPLTLQDQDFVLLPKGQSIERTIDLADLFPITKKGTYKILVSYRNDHDQPVGEMRAWKGAVISDPVEIVVN